MSKKLTRNTSPRSCKSNFNQTSKNRRQWLKEATCRTTCWSSKKMRNFSKRHLRNKSSWTSDPREPSGWSKTKLIKSEAICRMNSRLLIRGSLKQAWLFTLPELKERTRLWSTSSTRSTRPSQSSAGTGSSSNSDHRLLHPSKSILFALYLIQISGFDSFVNLLHLEFQGLMNSNFKINLYGCSHHFYLYFEVSQH